MPMIFFDILRTVHNEFVPQANTVNSDFNGSPPISYDQVQ